MSVVPGCPFVGPGVPANGNVSAPPTKISGPLCSSGVSTVLNRVFGGGAVSFDRGSRSAPSLRAMLAFG
jgi:hypothetical protein